MAYGKGKSRGRRKTTTMPVKSRGFPNAGRTTKPTKSIKSVKPPKPMKAAKPAAASSTAGAVTGKATAPGQLFKAQGLSNARTLAPGYANRPASPGGSAPNTPEEVHSQYGESVATWAKGGRTGARPI